MSTLTSNTARARPDKPALPILAGNDAAPHVGILHITVELHEQLSGGEVSGRPRLRKQVKHTFKGADKALAEARLNEVLELLCQKSDAPR